jgi:hypothetical protein
MIDDDYDDDDDVFGAVRGMIDRGNRNSRRKSAPVELCAGTRTAVGSQRLDV